MSTGRPCSRCQIFARRTSCSRACVRRRVRRSSGVKRNGKEKAPCGRPSRGLLLIFFLVYPALADRNRPVARATAGGAPRAVGGRRASLAARRSGAEHCGRRPPRAWFGGEPATAPRGALRGEPGPTL